MKSESSKQIFKKYLLLVFSFTFLFLAGSSASALTCDVKNACGAGETDLLKMSDIDNAHAGFVGSSAYTNIICCSEAGVTIGTNCGGSFDIFLKLSAIDNAHVGKVGFSAYLNDACISVDVGGITCDYSNVGCPAGYECLAEISGDDNAHIGDCNSNYTTKVCCKYCIPCPGGCADVGQPDGCGGFCPDNTDNPCDDGNACTLKDACNGGICIGIPISGGLVPCGKKCDDPTTAILENSPCSLCHFFVLVKRIVDFLFTAIILPLLLLGIIALGGFSIASRGNSERLAKGKHFFKEFGLGLTTAFGTWLIIETLIGGVVPNSRPWSNWTSLSCPVAPCDDATEDTTDDDLICETNLDEDSQNCPTDCPCDFNGVCDPVKEQIGLGNPEACLDCSVCGNGIIDAEEPCDPGPPALVIRGGLNPINGCTAFGYKPGNLGCAPDCKIDFSGCD